MRWRCCGGCPASSLGSWGTGCVEVFGVTLRGDVGGTWDWEDPSGVSVSRFRFRVSVVFLDKMYEKFHAEMSAPCSERGIMEMQWERRLRVKVGGTK